VRLEIPPTPVGGISLWCLPRWYQRKSHFQLHPVAGINPSPSLLMIPLLVQLLIAPVAIYAVSSIAKCKAIKVEITICPKEVPSAATTLT
jgi:hypothetical protein